MSQKLKKVQTDILALKAEISQVENAALDDKGISARVNAWLDEQSRTVNEKMVSLASELAYESTMPGAGACPSLMEVSYRYPGLGLALQAHLNRSAFHELLTQSAKASIKVRQVGNKEAELADLRGKLLDLERVEEAEIEKMEAVGEVVYRRADADPRAILGIPG